MKNHIKAGATLVALGLASVIGIIMLCSQMGKGTQAPGGQATIAHDAGTHDAGTTTAAAPAGTVSPKDLWLISDRKQPASGFHHKEDFAIIVADLDTRPAQTLLPVLKAGDHIEIAMPNGEITEGLVNLSVDDLGVRRVAGALPQMANGSFSLALTTDNQLFGHIVLPASGLVYEIEPAPNADASCMSAVAMSAMICDQPPLDEPERADVGRTEAAPLLDSRPSAAPVLLLVFDGATVTDPAWNYGNTIHAAPANLTIGEIIEVWKRVSEDFSPFDISVTTSQARYDNAPIGKRMRAIITPTRSWYGAAGGLAWPMSFRKGGGSYSSTVPCWVFNGSVVGASETASHEFGHTFNLSHDGRLRTGQPNEEYYSGHGEGAMSWGPIMGGPYSRTITQWSNRPRKSTRRRKPRQGEPGKCVADLSPSRHASA